ncbi:replication initiation protein [Enterococcus faecium]|nr:replication initiation protein [Enterococcus faecium]MCU1831688.1 replication initiation protein [Enterococcus faecium]MCU1834385.1 replication initiation protein [Enterococcus faecium]MCU1853068.1 replication initiation protein [Enterococcus faecium]MCU1878209.1 replication initiation protein [Enterococcus faecium]
MVQKNKKAELAVSELLSRQDYLVVQGNDLAKAFGGLKAFEQRILDYCFSFVTAESKASDEYEVSALELIKHFGLNASGQNYQRIAEAFKRLNENTALYLPIIEDGEKGILMTQLFSGIKFLESGRVKFKFSADAAPLVFDLKEHFYSFKLGQLSKINGKYALIFLKLWEAKRRAKEKYTTVEGTLEEWESWFFGKEKRVTAGQFYQQVIVRGTEELEQKLPVEFFVTTLKRGRKVVGYEITINDTSIQDLEGKH